MESALDRGEAPILGERLDRIDPRALDACHKREAGEPRDVVDEHGAGAALAAVTSGLGPGQPDDFPQIIEQQQVVRDRIDPRAAVEYEFKNPGHVGQRDTKLAIG